MGPFNFKRHASHIYYDYELGTDGKIKGYKSLTFAEFGAMGEQQ